MQALAAQHAGTANIQHLDVPPVLTRLSSAKCALESFKGETGGWRVPLQWLPLRARLETLLEEWKAARWEAEDLRISFGRCSSEQKRGVAKLRKQWNEHKAKLVSFAHRSNPSLPTALTQALGAVVYSFKNPQKQLASTASA